MKCVLPKTGRRGRWVTCEGVDYQGMLIYAVSSATVYKQCANVLT